MSEALVSGRFQQEMTLKGGNDPALMGEMFMLSLGFNF